MRTPGFAAIALLLLAGCEAGHRDDAGSDNLMAGPAVSITSPASRQTVGSGEVDVMLDLRNARPETGDYVGDAVLLFVDDEAPRVVLDATKGYRVTGLGKGTHLLRAVVVKEGGIPYTNAHAFAARVFHVIEGDEDRWTWRTPEGDERTVDPERDPVLTARKSTSPMDGFQGLHLVVGGAGSGAYVVQTSGEGQEPSRHDASTLLLIQVNESNPQRIRLDVVPAHGEPETWKGRPLTSQEFAFGTPAGP